ISRRRNTPPERIARKPSCSPRRPATVFRATQRMQYSGDVLGGQAYHLAFGADHQIVGLAQRLPESREVRGAHTAVGIERVAVGFTINNDIETVALIGAVLPASDAGVGADIAIFFIVGAGDIQLVAVAIVHQMLTDTHAPAGGPFV